eukprot:137287-Ditylum_brightwellii.AAC.1
MQYAAAHLKRGNDMKPLIKFLKNPVERLGEVPKVKDTDKKDMNVQIHCTQRLKEMMLRRMLKWTAMRYGCFRPSSKFLWKPVESLDIFLKKFRLAVQTLELAGGIE